VVVFCHFDGQGRIRDHTRDYINALRDEGFDIVFVTNSGQLAPPDLAWLRARAARVVIRRNVGYDFAAWRDAMASCRLPKPGTKLLVIANDSVYGPMQPISSMLKRINFELGDVWGVTDSWQHRFHLQSYFVAFGPAALASEAFTHFWSSVRNVRSKRWVVTRYEVGLTRTLIAAGLRCRAVWPYTDLIRRVREAAAQDGADEPADQGDVAPAPQQPLQIRRSASCDPMALAERRNAERILRAALERVPLNPTADLWQVLLDQGCPFLKRELLRDNPSRVPDVAAWTSLVKEIRGFDHDVILRDLERSLRRRTP
jgi:lipopolysaccharide biosynthesis protein